MDIHLAVEAAPRILLVAAAVCSLVVVEAVPFVSYLLSHLLRSSLQHCIRILLVVVVSKSQVSTILSTSFNVQHGPAGILHTAAAVEFRIHTAAAATAVLVVEGTRRTVVCISQVSSAQLSSSLLRSENPAASQLPGRVYALLRRIAAVTVIWRRRAVASLLPAVISLTRVIGHRVGDCGSWVG